MGARTSSLFLMASSSRLLSSGETPPASAACIWEARPLISGSSLSIIDLCILERILMLTIPSASNTPPRASVRVAIQ